jgi:hypothetical protein
MPEANRRLPFTPALATLIGVLVLDHDPTVPQSRRSFRLGGVR